MEKREKIMKVNIFPLMNALITNVVHSIPNFPKVTEMMVDHILLVQFPTALHSQEKFYL
jgi:hypothetical protein